MSDNFLRKLNEFREKYLRREVYNESKGEYVGRVFSYTLNENEKTGELEGIVRTNFGFQIDLKRFENGEFKLPNPKKIKFDAIPPFIHYVKV